MKTMYIDPGTGSMLISAIIALISVGFFMLKGFIYQKFNLGGKDSNKGANIDLSKAYGLVFYSEGKQYWNVFKPLIEESSRRSIAVTYFTSDQEDPGLDCELEYVDTQYIGTGREAFYVLNRMTADMLVMTTPGLDVLEIKKNKNIKHYSHVTHATGSIADYKAYGVDYYDSVLLGGEGDIEVISELESKRHLEKKELEIIGHTYLDEYRKKLTDAKYTKTFFKEDKPVILLSPTWGNHGLLTKYGKKILSSLENSEAFNVIIRPHPQSFISEEKLMEELMESYPANKNRIWDRDVDGLISMSQADIMISDFSGIIFDFASLFEKPILTMHGQYEKRGRDANDLDENPWNLKIVESLGRTINESDIVGLTEIIKTSLSKRSELTGDITNVKDIFDKYPGESAIRGVDYIENKLSDIQKSVPNQEETLKDSFVSNNLVYRSSESASLVNKVKEAFKNIFHGDALLQMFIASILLNLYILLGQKLLPEKGLNQEFLEKLLPYSVRLSIGLFIIWLFLTWVIDKGSLLIKKEFESMELKDILLIFLPLTPIIQYIMANQDMLSIGESTKVFLFFGMLAITSLVVVPFILSPVVSKSLTIPVSLGFLFILFNMASFGRETQPLRIGITLGVLILSIFLILYFNQKNILFVAVTVFFLANIASFALDEDLGNNQDQSDGIRSESRILKYTEGKVPVNTPDVYLLISESYSNEETMDLYGYDNSEQIDYLMNNGFAIYDGTYTLGRSSLESMGRVLETDFIGKGNDELREAIAVQSSVLELFNQLDYRTNIVLTGGYMINGFIPKYNHYFPNDEYSIAPHKIIVNAILEGEFRFDVDFSKITYEEYLTEKQNILSRNASGSQFLYTHNKYPNHSQNSGVLRPNETELHIEGILKANEEMQEDIEKIQLENKDAIVIIAGDHGPYLTKNGYNLDNYELDEIERMDIQDRFGAFLAIHWPDSTYEEKYDIQILQDIFPAIISYIYEDDSLFDKIRMERKTKDSHVIGGATVEEGIIVGGKDDGLPLFENNGVRSNNK